MNLKIAIISNLKVLFKNSIFFVKKFYYYYFQNLFLKKELDVNFNFKNCNLIIPNKIIPILVLEEVFVFNMYKHLSGLNCILDLGGYLGDSTVYLSILNKQVIAYEADDINYKYLKLNTEKIKNITVKNKAVVFSDKKKSIFSNSENFDYGGNVSNFFNKSKKKEVLNENISQILKKNPSIDGIKVDIEGGEYEILKYFLKYKKNFNLKKGYIEIHFFGKNQTNYNLLKDFINLLKSKSYQIIFYDIYNSKMNESIIEENFNSLKKKEEFIFHLIFNKK